MPFFVSAKINNNGVLIRLPFFVCQTASRLSIALEGEASASPFPSPSSSFLPPPTPGAHEFAVKPAPANRLGRKLSATASAAIHAPTNGDGAPRTELVPERTPLADEQGNGHVQAALAPTPKDTLSPAPLSPALVSPTTPTPHTLQHQHSTYLEPPCSPGPGPGPEQSTSSATTPTVLTSTLPPEEPELATITIPNALEPGPGGNASTPTSPAFSTFSAANNSRPPSGAPSLSSWRAAPPSPALSDTPTLSDATILNESPHLRPPPRAPAPRAGRRYLAPAYVRGQCLPFAIDEEEESQSMSKHSAESATRLADGGAKAAASATTTTTTTTNVHNASASAFPCGGYLGDEPLSPDAEPDRAWRSVPMERRRSGKKRSSFRKRVHRVMLVIPALTMRSGLWF